MAGSCWMRREPQLLNENRIFFAAIGIARRRCHRMIRSSITALGLVLLVFGEVKGVENQPLLAIEGKLLRSFDLQGAPPKPWRAAKGLWQAASGGMSGEELAQDNHGAVLRLPDQMQDFVIEYEVMLDGARSTTLSINALKDHMARIVMTPTMITIQRDDNDHDGPDKSVIFARFATELKPGVWHRVRLEMVGDKMLGKVDDLVAWGSSDLFTKTKAAPGFTVSGKRALMRHFRMVEATLNPNWNAVAATLPKPGEKVAAVPAAAQGKAKAKGKGKGKAGAAKKAKASS